MQDQTDPNGARNGALQDMSILSNTAPLMIIGNRSRTCEQALFQNGHLIMDVYEELHGTKGVALLGAMAERAAAEIGKPITYAWVPQEEYLDCLGYTPFDDMAELIRSVWGKDTALGSDWTEDQPSLGQAAATAILVNDMTAMPVIRGRALRPDGTIVMHYWNQGLDLTADQFPEGTAISATPGLQGRAARDYLTAFNPVFERYAALRERFDEARRRQKLAS
jgi:hypothetical protein